MGWGLGRCSATRSLLGRTAGVGEENIDVAVEVQNTDEDFAGNVGIKIGSEEGVTWW